MPINTYFNKFKDGIFDLFVIEDENRVYATPITVVKGFISIFKFFVITGLNIYGLYLILHSIRTGEFALFTILSEDVTIMSYITLFALVVVFTTFIFMIYLIFRKLCVYLNNLVIFEKYQ